MLILSSALFLIAMIAACAVIVSSISDNFDRIAQVVEQRSGQVRSARKITVGALRSPAPRAATINVVKLKQPVSPQPVPSNIQSEEWRLAA
jgi:hypothetical protein